MRTIERTGQFKRDFKRESKGQHRLTLQADLTAVVMALANDQILDSRHRDHGLTGDWKDQFRHKALDCIGQSSMQI